MLEAAQASQGFAPGWRLDAEGRIVRETIHRMTRRLIDWDYRAPAIYQITIVAADRAASPFGSLKLGARADQSDATVELSPLGVAVADCWESIPEYYSGIKIIGKQVMPDHFHGLLWVKEPLSVHLGQVIKGFKTGCNKAARALGVLTSTTMSPSTGRESQSPSTGRGSQSPSTGRESQSPSTVRGRLTASVGRLTTGGVFAEGFQDSILFGEGQLKKMINYLADNPRRLAIKRLAPDLFTVANRVALPLVWSEGRVCRSWFSTIGNRFLLERPLYQVQVSRRFFRYQRQAKTGGGLKIARDATAMNRLCQALAREGAAEINYHGITPTDVDTLAWDAAEMEEVK